MNLINYFSLFVVFGLLILGFFVLKRDSRNATHRVFSLLAFCGAFWVFSNFMIDIAKSQKFAILWGKLVILGPIFIPALLVYFSYIFPLKTVSMGKLRLLLIHIPALVLSAMVPTSLNIRRVIISSEAPNNVVPGVLYFIFFTYCLLYVAWVFLNLARSYKISSGRQKMQIIYVYLGIFCVVTLGLITNILVVLAGGSNILPSIGPPLYTPIFVASTAYAIVKHRLMDIRLLVLKSVAYSLTLAIIAGLYATAAYLLLGRFKGLVSYNAFNITVIFLAIFGFVPLRRSIEKYTDKIFAKGRYNFEDLLKKLGKLMSTKVVLRDLTTLTLEILVKEMRLTRAGFVIMQDSRVEEVEAIGYKSKSVSFWDKARKLVEDRKGIIIADELAEDSKQKEILRRLNAEILLPLIAEESLVGVLALGEKRSGDMFTAQDVRLLEIIAPEAAIAVNNASLFKEKEKRIEELNSLNKLALSMGSTLHLDELLEELIDEAIKVSGGETGSIMLLDEETQTLSIKAARGIPPEVYKRAKTKVGEGIAGWVAKTSNSAIIIDSEHENEYLQKCLKREEITSALSVPLKIRNKVIGVLSVNRKKKKEVFTEEALNLMTSYAAQAAEAIENARLFEKSERQFMETITTLSGAVEAKDPYTRGHSDAVTKYAVSIAKEMGLPSEEIRNIEIAGRLHDIGKIGIPEAILNKPGRLSKEEREIINQHPRISVDILKPAGSLKDIIPTILYHHERFDGKGYPTGLAGKAIPLGARILAVADSFNAMTTDRPYRLALSLEGTIRELKENAGAQFDPDVVEAMLKVLETSELKPEVKVDHRTRHVKPLSAVS